MKIQTIGNYTIFKHKLCKQIYSPRRMLQIHNNKVYYVDLINSKLIKVYERVKNAVFTRN
jgi:hypothetical protein